MLPFFKKSEDFVSVTGEKNFHGVGGELKVSRERFTDPIVKIFLEAGEELGYPVGDTNGDFEDSGFTIAQTTTHQGFRAGAFEAFAEQFVGGNLTVMTHAHVTRVLVEEGRAVGVEVDRFGDRLRLEASREVVLSAGTVGTPQILMLSGIGDRQHLKEVSHLSTLHFKVGVEPLVDLPEVGRNLQDHLMSGLSASVLPGLSMDPLAMFYPSTWTALAGGEGPLTHTGCDGIAFVRTERQDIGDPRPDIQFHMIAASLATDRGMLLKDLIGFKADDPVDPWWQPHVGKDTFTLAPTLLRWSVGKSLPHLCSGQSREVRSDCALPTRLQPHLSKPTTSQTSKTLTRWWPA